MILGKNKDKTSFSQMLLNKSTFFFICALSIILLPVKRVGEEKYQVYYIGILVLVQVAFLLYRFFKRKDKDSLQSSDDIVMITFIVLMIAEIITNRFNLIDAFLYPTPGRVAYVFLAEFPAFLVNLKSSAYLIGTGYFLAVVTAIPLGIIIGWRKRLYRIANPISKVLAPIPPIVYIPYAIAILPTFKMGSIFIIFIGAFWPIFVNTLSGTLNIEKRIVDSAKTLNVSEFTMMYRVILPGITPSVMSGVNIGLLLSFILLASAEMIGAVSGLGWYIKYFSDFANYANVIVGIIYISIVVTIVTYFVGRIEKYLLRWKQ